jgi:nicotinate-nucleotide pyrophosphorylase
VGGGVGFRTSINETIMIKTIHFHICIAMQE